MIGLFHFLRQIQQRPSIGELDIDLKLKMSNYEETVRQLDIYYGIGIIIHVPYILIYTNHLNIFFLKLIFCIGVVSQTAVTEVSEFNYWTLPCTFNWKGCGKCKREYLLRCSNLEFVSGLQVMSSVYLYHQNNHSIALFELKADILLVNIM